MQAVPPSVTNVWRTARKITASPVSIKRIRFGLHPFGTEFSRYRFVLTLHYGGKRGAKGRSRLTQTTIKLRVSRQVIEYPFIDGKPQHRRTDLHSLKTISEARLISALGKLEGSRNYQMFFIVLKPIEHSIDIEKYLKPILPSHRYNENFRFYYISMEIRATSE